MAEEIEAKIRIESPDAFRRRMAERNLVPRPTVLEENRLFDDAAGTLRRRGAALRVRQERAEKGGPVLRTTLAYKGPLAESDLKRRPEFEVPVESAEPLVAILEAIGLRETFRYEKRRTVWPVGRCEVALDEVPHLGWFVEVEGPSEKAVRSQLADLGLAGAETVRKDYVHLLVERLESLGRDPPAGRSPSAGEGPTRAVF